MALESWFGVWSAINMIGLIRNYLIPLNVIEHVVDNYMFDKVTPVIGSIVYVDFIITGSIIQHSGIYVGDGKIVHLNKHGMVEEVSPSDFIGGMKCGSSIYVSCHDTDPVGCEYATDFAQSEIGNSYDYSIIKFNCHQFIASCISGFINPPDDMEAIDRVHSTLTGLKLNCRENINSNNWRVWDI